MDIAYLSQTQLLPHWSHVFLALSHHDIVTLCFQFVSTSAAMSAAAAMTFASHIKTVWANPYIFGTKKVLVSENVLDDLLVTLTQGHGCDVDKQQFAFLQDKVRTTQPITTKRGSYISLVMPVTWLEFRGILLEIFLFAKFSLKILDAHFSRSNILLDISLEWLVRLMWNEKWPWPLTSLMTLNL